MYRWLRNWRARRRLRRERNLFEYFDGMRYRRIDPMDAYRRLDKHETFHWEIGIDIESGDMDAMHDACNAVCNVFGLQKWSGDVGLTEGEILEVLYQYVVYIDELKKKSNDGLISPMNSDLGSSKSEEHQN